MGKRGYGRVTNNTMRLTHYRGVDLNRTDKFVLFTLIAKQGATMEAKITNRILANMADLGIRTIQRSVDKLERIGLITRQGLGSFTVQSDFLYQKGDGFGKIYVDVLESDLSIYAKLLYVVNVVACGDDDSHFFSREKLMEYTLMNKDNYTKGMKELETANIVIQSYRSREECSGVLYRTTNNKYILNRDRYCLTFERYIRLKNNKCDKRRKQNATKGGHSGRHLKDTERDNRGTAYNESLSLITTTNLNHESYTADSSNHDIFLLNSYQAYFCRGFDHELLNGYEYEEVEKVVRLFDGIRTFQGRPNWRISESDFAKLIDHVNTFNDDEYPEVSISDYIEFVRDLMIIGRRGESLSYWLSEGVRGAFRGRINAEACGFEFELDQ